LSGSGRQPDRRIEARVDGALFRLTLTDPALLARIAVEARTFQFPDKDESKEGA
jgi:hypothetical protein